MSLCCVDLVYFYFAKKKKVYRELKSEYQHRLCECSFVLLLALYWNNLDAQLKLKVPGIFALSQMTMRRDFDRWAYGIEWPQNEARPMSRCALLAEDIKFAFNAWCLLRLGLFFGTCAPGVMSSLARTTPSMHIAERGNRIFHMFCNVNEPLAAKRCKIALTPSHPRAVSLCAFDWQSAFSSRYPQGVQLVLGMENGLTEATVRSCEHAVYIPQYGSIGSLSMMSALAIAVHHAHTALLGTFGNSSPYDAAKSRVLKKLRPTPIRASLVPPASVGERRPHTDDLLGTDDLTIKRLLAEERSKRSLQLGAMWYNEWADRNIGATIRNMNVFNCEKLVLVNRRKFNRRGTVGTHHYLPIVHCSTMEHAKTEIAGWSLWGLHQHYVCFPAPQGSGLSGDACNASRMAKAVFADDEMSVVQAVHEEMEARRTGIMLVTPEEGSDLPPQLEALCDRVMYVVSPSRAFPYQRGLTAQMGSAICFERIHFAREIIEEHWKANG